jgi:hypothetical protein
VVARLRQNQQLTAVASAFLFLQEQREAANYDHDADLTRASTLALVRRANRLWVTSALPRRPPTSGRSWA